MAAKSKRSIYAALVGNSLIAATKYAAAFLTGSSAMLAQAVHSTSDTANQVLIEQIRRSKDPTLFVVLFEDTAALSGIVVAAVGIFLANQLGNPYFDGAASVVIGLILMTVAFWLAYESKSLLVGESASHSMVRRIGEIVRSDDLVNRARNVLTLQLGPEEVLVNMDVEFRENLSPAELHESIGRLERSIKDEFSQVMRIFIEIDPFREREKRDEGAPTSSEGEGDTS